MKISKKIFLGLLLTSMVAVSCDDFLDVNESPNNPPTAPIEGLMVRTTLETTRNTQRVASTTSFFVQHFASPNQASSTDTHEDVSYGFWSNLYFVLGDIVDMIDLGEEFTSPHYIGVGHVLKAYNLSLLVNMYGDVPYTDALRAQTLNPTYDTSESIYNVIDGLITDAIANLGAAESTLSPGDDDFIFGGDLASWTRTAYALRARTLNHRSKLASYNPGQVIAALNNAFMSNDDDFEMNFFDQGTGTRNPWYNMAVSNAGLLLGGWLSDQFVDQLNGTTFGVVDPRIGFITAPASNLAFPDLIGQYIGTRNGAGRGAAPEANVRAVLAVGSWYASGATAPLQMMTYAEMKFIEAEAKLALSDPTAIDAYEDGIRAHMEKLGVPDGDIDDYWDELEVSNPATFNINKVMKEKFVAMFLMPEAWNDARRHDYAYAGFQLPANHNPALNGQMIRRVSYPDSEFQRNEAQVPQKTLADRIFWDTP